MNLRIFHLLFIAMSTLLAAFVAAWALERYSSNGTVADGVLGVLSMMAAVGLVAYGLAFRRRSRYW